MLRVEYLTCIELHKRLKEIVTGGVFITIKDDNLYVYISGPRNIKYTYEYKGVSLEMLNYGAKYNLNYDKVIRIIMNDYKEFIMKKFFRG